MPNDKALIPTLTFDLNLGTPYYFMLIADTQEECFNFAAFSQDQAFMVEYESEVDNLAEFLEDLEDEGFFTVANAIYRFDDDIHQKWDEAVDEITQGCSDIHVLPKTIDNYPNYQKVLTSDPEFKSYANPKFDETYRAVIVMKLI